MFYRKGSTCTLKMVGLLWVNLQPEYHWNSWLRRNAQWLWCFWNPHFLPPSLLPPSQRTEEEEKNTSTISNYIRDQTDHLIRVASLSFGIIDCLFSFLYSLLSEDKMVGRSLAASQIADSLNQSQIKDFIPGFCPCQEHRGLLHKYISIKWNYFVSPPLLMFIWNEASE